MEVNDKMFLWIISLLMDFAIIFAIEYIIWGVLRLNYFQRHLAPVKHRVHNPSFFTCECVYAVTLKVGLKASEDSLPRQENRETLLINQREDKLKAESRWHGTTLHASAGTAAQHKHK